MNRPDNTSKDLQNLIKASEIEIINHYNISKQNDKVSNTFRNKADSDETDSDKTDSDETDSDETDSDETDLAEDDIEIWEPIDDTKYMISSHGRCKNPHGRILTLTPNKWVYTVKCKAIRAARAVALAFKIKDYHLLSDHKTFIKHIDGNPANNHVKNLLVYNSNDNKNPHAPLTFINKKKYQKVAQYDKNNKFIAQFDSIASAARNFSNGTETPSNVENQIRKCAKKEQNHKKLFPNTPFLTKNNYIWKFVD